MRISRHTLAKAAKYQHGLLEIERVAFLTADREVAERSFRTRPMFSIGDAQKSLTSNWSECDIRAIAARPSFAKSTLPVAINWQPIPCLSDWLIIEDVSSLLADAAAKGQKLSERSAVIELKQGKYRSRHKAKTIGSLRQRLRRARERQERWEAYAIANWTMGRKIIAEHHTADVGKETGVSSQTRAICEKVDELGSLLDRLNEENADLRARLALTEGSPVQDPQLSDYSRPHSRV